MGASTVDCRQGCAPLQTSQAAHQSREENPRAGGIRETQVWLPSDALSRLRSILHADIRVSWRSYMLKLSWVPAQREKVRSCMLALDDDRGLICRLCVCVCAEAEARSKAGHRMTLYNEERRSWLHPWKPSTQGLDTPVCSMVLPPALGTAWAGPRIRMQLPSFSGATAECPQLLQYTCQLCTNVRAVPAAIVEVRVHPPGVPGSQPCFTLL